MADKMRKIYCEERTKDTFNKLSMKELQDLAGFVSPVKVDGEMKWEVATLFEGHFFTADTQEIAELMASLEMIKGLLLKRCVA